MRKYSEFVAEAGPCPEGISTKYEWLAYKDGVCEIFDSKSKADKFSKLIECRCTNELEKQNSLNEIRTHRKNLYDSWYQELRSSNSSLPDAVFEKFYEKACSLDYDMQYGPDAIVDHLEGLVEFYKGVDWK